MSPFAPRKEATFAERKATVYLAAALLCLCGCTSFSGLCTPRIQGRPRILGAKAEVAPQWIDAADPRVRSTPADLSRWWCVFNDPVLNDLIYHAYAQNITLKEAGAGYCKPAPRWPSPRESFSRKRKRLQEAMAARISAPPGFPPFPKFNDDWNFGFNLAWELDFWGRFRRACSVAGPVGRLGGELRRGAGHTDGRRCDKLCADAADAGANRAAKQNVKLQQDVLKSSSRGSTPAGPRSGRRPGRDHALSDHGHDPGFRDHRCGKARTRSARCWAFRPPICSRNWASCRFPRRRRRPWWESRQTCSNDGPTFRRAERAAAAQSEQIGIAETDWYPHISILGTFGYSTTGQGLSQLFTPANQFGSVGPSFQWNILEYGRIANNVRLQDATFQAPC